MRTDISSILIQNPVIDITCSILNLELRVIKNRLAYSTSITILGILFFKMTILKNSQKDNDLYFNLENFAYFTMGVLLYGRISLRSVVEEKLTHCIAKH